MIMRVNPTRMELSKLKKRLKTAVRGHKLLKDKLDELMKQFLEIIRKNRELRKKVEADIAKMHSNFLVASAVMSKPVLEQAFMLPKFSARFKVGYRNIMSVNVPTMTFNEFDTKNIYTYGLYGTTSDLDYAIRGLADMLPSLLALAEIEKTAQLLAAEIEKTRRRVNALEHVMIPQMNETIKYISMKLDEDERGSRTRLMKVKDMMIEQAIRSKQARGSAENLY